MMQSIRSGRGVVCLCCNEWTVTRAREKRLWRKELPDEIAYWAEREDSGDV